MTLSVLFRIFRKTEKTMNFENVIFEMELRRLRRRLLLMMGKREEDMHPMDFHNSVFSFVGNKDLWIVKVFGEDLIIYLNYLRSVVFMNKKLTDPDLGAIIDKCIASLGDDIG